MKIKLSLITVISLNGYTVPYMSATGELTPLISLNTLKKY